MVKSRSLILYKEMWEINEVLSFAGAIGQTYLEEKEIRCRFDQVYSNSLFISFSFSSPSLLVCFSAPPPPIPI